MRDFLHTYANNWVIRSCILITIFLYSISDVHAQAEIRVAKTIPKSGVESQNGINLIKVHHVLRIYNTGSEDLTDLQVTDDLADGAHYSTAFAGLDGIPQILSQPSGTSFDIDPAYDGDLLPDILSSSNLDTLPAGDSLVLRVSAVINLNNIAVDETKFNQAVASAMGTVAVMDLSDSGADPASDNLNDPLRTALGLSVAGNDDLTPLPYCHCMIPCPPTLNASFDQNCEFDVSELYGSLGGVEPICSYLGFYTFDIKNSSGISISGPVITPYFIKDELCYSVDVYSICNNAEFCSFDVCLKVSNVPVINGSSYTVYCNDPVVTDPGLSTPPIATIPCQGDMESAFAGDWIETYDCDPGVQDTAKIIYRQYAAISKNGMRGVGFDTLYVLRLPPITDVLFCPERDTVYCGEGDFGPYLLLPDLTGATMNYDTLSLFDEHGDIIPADHICGLSAIVNETPFSSSGCSGMTKYEVKIYQYCYGESTQSAPMLPDGPIYEVCEFWRIDLDTAAPVLSCDLTGYSDVDTINGLPVITVDAGQSCTSGTMILPPVAAVDSCNEVTQVKAMIQGLGTYPMELDTPSGLYVNPLHVALPARPDPYIIVYEAMDNCFNTVRDSCGVIVKDMIAPTVATVNIGVELSAKSAIVMATQIDNGTFDNCDLEYLLSRRVDWQDAWPDYCDSLRIETVTTGMDTIWCKFIDPASTDSELEAYYGGAMEDIALAMGVCSELLTDAWMYDLCRYASVDCMGSISDSRFDSVYAEAFGLDNVDELSLIGGGWAPGIPISCADICDSVTVELLALDSCCNWSTGWAKIKVEDKIGMVIPSDVVNMIPVSCDAYNYDTAYALPGFSDPVALNEVVVAAESGVDEAFDILDATFGGYTKAWEDGAFYVDINGDTIDTDFTYTDPSSCVCTTVSRMIPEYDPMMMDLDTMATVDVDSCYFTDEVHDLVQGILLVNCADNTYCEQTIESNLGDCGFGTITRQWKIWKYCGTETMVDTTYRSQVIEVGNTCALSQGMFDLPGDTVLYDCMPELDASLNVGGPAHPDSVGRPEFLFASDCWQVGVGYDDFVDTIAGNSCYVVHRTWYFADWCVEDSSSTTWWDDQSIVSDSFVQHILFKDTEVPTYSSDLDAVIMNAICGDDLMVSLEFGDSCALYDYTYQVETVGSTPTIIIDEDGMLEGELDDTVIVIPSLTPGDYVFRIRVTDHCNNEIMDEIDFTFACTRTSARDMADNPAVNEVETPALGSMDPDMEDVSLDDPYRSPSGQAELYQNRPNPFRNHTIIGFTLPEESQTYLTVYDIHGRVLKEHQGVFGKGYHEWSINLDDLGVSGILYYQMRSKNYAATRKMIVTQ